MAINIANKLEVLFGNKLLVVGCEPVSAFTSTALAVNRDCGASVIDLADALEAIPGSTVVAWVNPRRLFFVLPDGPPPKYGCAPVSCKTTDYYEILREIGKETSADQIKNIFEIGTELPPTNIASPGVCDIFPFKRDI